MSKKVKRNKKTENIKTSNKEKHENNLLKQFKKYEIYIYIFLMIALVTIYFSPIIFQGYRPGGSDVIGSSGKTHQVKEWTKKTGDKYLWNPVLFSGMPTYYNLKTTYNLDSLIKLFSNIIYNPILYYFIGVLGMFFLLRYLRFHNFVSFFGALAFVFFVHWATLLQIGHFMKFRPVMMLPFILSTFLRIMDKPSLLNLGLYSIVQACQIRTQHYQIIFYTAILLLFVGINKIILIIRNKENLTKRLIFMSLAVILFLGMIIQPLILIKEYTPSSIRGGTGAENSKGLGLDYATSWSFHPQEAFNFLIPRYFGGASAETYNVSNPQYPQLVGKKVSGYWGHMPFTESTEYIGIIILFFALIGIIKTHKNPLTITLLILSFFCLLLSFGRHFEAFYKIFFNYLPVFNKFRVPSMALFLVYFSSIIFAAFGLQSFVSIKDENDKKQLLKICFISCGILLGVGIIALISSGSMQFYRAQDMGRYDNQTLTMFKSIRKEFLVKDTQRLILFSVIIAIVSIAYLKNWLKSKYIFLTLVTIFLLVDLFQIQGRFLMEKVNGNYTNLSQPDLMKKSYFKEKPTDKFLLNQKRKDLDFAEYRIYPIVQNIWSTNDYSYHHQSIGGYSPAKIRAYQDLMDFGRMKNTSLFSRNIPNMLNAKYYLVPGQLPQTDDFKNLTPVYNSKEQIIYENEEACGRGWFVGNYVVGKTRKERFDYLNSKTFDVKNSAILENEITHKIDIPENDEVKLTKLNPNELSFSVKNDNNSLFVISEVYYPHGWKAFVDGKETEIFKTNHTLRSIYVPAGSHKIDMIFDPQSLKTTHWISLLSTIIAFGLLIFGLYKEKMLSGKKLSEAAVI